MKEIITDYGALSDRSDEIDVKKKGGTIREIILALKEIIADKNLVALAAPQIGYFYRIFVINFNGDLKTFINPIITNATGLDLSRETCESIPGKTFMRPRSSKIKIVYMNPLGRVIQSELMGRAAHVFQEQIDHLDGLLLSDVGLEIDEDFDKATEAEKDEVIDAYLKSLDLKRKDLTEEAKKDKETAQLADAIDFMESVQKGETVVKQEKLEFDKVVKEKK